VTITYSLILPRFTNIIGDTHHVLYNAPRRFDKHDDLLRRTHSGRAQYNDTKRDRLRGESM